jgi:hypothetical protein
MLWHLRAVGCLKMFLFFMLHDEKVLDDVPFSYFMMKKCLMMSPFSYFMMKKCLMMSPFSYFMMKKCSTQSLFDAS